MIIKRNGLCEEFNPDKILTAVKKASERSGEDLSNFKIPYISQEKQVTVDEIHNILTKALEDQNFLLTREAYQSYVHYKRHHVEVMQKLHESAKTLMTHGDRENANAESTLISTQQSLLRGELTKELYKQNYLSNSERSAVNDGFIYIHDSKDLLFGGFNCGLFDIGAVLKGGFEMANLKYDEPSSILSALQLIGDITLAASAQQFGGFTLAEIDKVLVPYLLKSRVNYQKEAEEYCIKDSITFINNKVKRELEQGFQSLEMKLNSIPSSRGDFAFTTLTFGNLDCEYKEEQQLICNALLKQRMSKNPVVFPKLVMLFSWEQNQNCELQQELFDLCIECSSENLYPDYLAIDTQGQVSDLYRSTSKVVSPMGCRAYLSDYKDENGESYFVGRGNIGACSLNLPMVYMKAKTEGVDFYETLEYYLQMIRNFHLKRYDFLSKIKASTNPLCFTQGGMKGGNLKPEDTIESILKSFTSSFGITSLNELNILMEGESLHNKNYPAINEVLDFINKRVSAFKEEDGKLYALYGTPAESLAGTQLEQFKAKYGVIEGVSDRGYFSNSHHCHVSAEISPFEKQDREFRNYHTINGGHINYSRVDTNNLPVMKGIMLRAMSLGYYSGFNANHTFCDECSWSGKESVDSCPSCGSGRIMEINRVSGYLGYSKQKGSTRFNDSKLEELKDRVSM